MAVTVVTQQFTSGEPALADYYEDAGHFFEKDGHLYVVRHKQVQDSVALYSPGAWLFAFVGEKVVRKSGDSALVD